MEAPGQLPSIPSPKCGHGLAPFRRDHAEGIWIAAGLVVVVLCFVCLHVWGWAHFRMLPSENSSSMYVLDFTSPVQGTFVCILITVMLSDHSDK